MLDHIKKEQINYIVSECLTKNNKLNHYKKLLYHPILQKYTEFLPTISNDKLRWYCLKNNITNIPLCKTCNEMVTITKNTITLRDYCSNKCVNNSSEMKIKRTQTILNKFGVDNAFQSNEIKNKIKQTNLKKYGVEYACQSDTVKNKIKQTNLEKYGVEFYCTLNIFKQKSKQTNLEKYGVEYACQSDIIKNKIKQTNLEKYGVEFYSQNNITFENMKLLNNKEWLAIQNKSKTLVEISQLLNVAPSTIRQKFIKYDIQIIHHHSSKEENLIESLLTELNIYYIKNDRKLISPYELDFYLPDYKLAIEVNGIYWHCELQGKDKNYHLNKTTLCENKGIKLIHIYDNDINFKFELISSRLKSQFGLSEKIFARKCTIVNVSNDKAREFLIDNHIQSNVNSKTQYGLEYNNELVSVMTFGKSRFNSADYELLRFCNKKGFTIIGGASKLLKKFRIGNKGSIVSYADRNWSTGNLYEQLGFEFLHNSNPNYKYTKDNIKLESRNKYMKHKLKDKLVSFDPNLTEYQNMTINGYDRIWDCGNKVYKLNK